MASRHVSRLALGTAQFGQAYGPSGRQVSLGEAHDIIRDAADAGIDTIDTATAYGDAEARLGEIGVRHFRVVTKMMQRAEEIDPSRLHIQQFYAVLMHRPSAELYDALYDLKARGITEKIGISIYSPCELDILIPRFKFDLVQAPLNLSNRDLATSGWLCRLKDMGLEVHTRSVFGRGELLAAYALADCLGLPLSYPEIDRVIVGVDSAAQLGEIIACVQSL